MTSSRPPTLPAQSPDPEARERGIAEAREAYRYDRSYAGLPFLESLPWSEEFSPRYLAKGAEVVTQIEANHAAGAVEAEAREVFGSPAADAWSRMYPLLPTPASVPVWHEDWAFAWQRLAGPVPVALRRVDELPGWLPVTDEDLARVLGPDAGTVAGALAGRRLYEVDYAVLDGLAAGSTDGRAKYLWAPVALFVTTPAAPGGLLPVAIQTAGHRGDRSTIYTPGDPGWLLARTTVQVADENMQGVLVHIGWCHLVTQCFLIAAHRQMSVDHPLMRLLEPHFEYTLAVNEVARRSVINPGGTQDRLLAPTIEAQMATLLGSLRGLDYASLDPHTDLARRGVDDTGALPVYPFRDDGLLLWGILRRFVDGYVRLYYASDEDVTGDRELAAWVREVGAPDGGQMPRLVEGAEPRTVDQVVELVARVIFRLTAYHASINDASYDWVGYVPNMPTAGFAPLPARGREGESDLSAMLPPRKLGWEAISATRQVAALHVNHLGDYPRAMLDDGRVGPLIATLQAGLREAEAIVRERNVSRPLPYEYMLPSRMTAGINA